MARQGKKFEPTPEQRAQVKALVLAGNSQDKIAKIIGISKMTLHKHFKEDLVNTRALADAQVVAALLKNALKGNVAAQKFWLENNLGWNQTKPEAAIPQAPPVPMKVRGPGIKRMLPDIEVDKNGTDGE